MFRTIYFAPDGSGGDASVGASNDQTALSEDQVVSGDGNDGNGKDLLPVDENVGDGKNGTAASEGGADEKTEKADEAKTETKEGGDVVSDFAKLLPDEDEITAYLESDVVGMKDFQKKNTQRAMAIADERKSLEEERNTFYSQMEKQMDDLRQMQSQVMAAIQRGSSAGLPSENEYGYEDVAGSGNEGHFDPRIEGRLKQLEESIGMMNLTYSDQQAHNVLKQKYGDNYDVRAVQERINKMNGPMDLNEIVFKAMAFEKNDLSAVKAQAFKDGQNAMLKKFEEIAKKRKKIAEPALKSGGGNKRAPKPKSLKEARERGLQEMKNSGRSFFE